MLYTAERFGARGSSFVLAEGSMMDRRPVPERTEGRGMIVTATKAGGITLDCVLVRPIPPRELWFEKVWNEFNANQEGSRYHACDLSL